jgi:GrpB-like predicted nucleotidyltransferase (UPF0157 family)
MKALPLPPDEYYERYKTRPVVVKPFDPAATEVAHRYIRRLRQLLAGLHAGLALRGSTAWGIAGKGDIEIGVYPEGEEWKHVLRALEDSYGPPGNVEPDYARFNDSLGGFEIEIIVLRGYSAVLDHRLASFLAQRPDLLAEYEQVKRQYAFSRREYQRQKDCFFARVVAMMPDEENDGSTG